MQTIFDAIFTEETYTLGATENIAKQINTLENTISAIKQASKQYATALKIAA